MRSEHTLHLCGEASFCILISVCRLRMGQRSVSMQEWASCTTHHPARYRNFKPEAMRMGLKKPISQVRIEEDQ
jgi:hypothetical protein